MENLKEIVNEIRLIITEKQKEFELTFEEDEHIYTMRDINGVLRNDFPSVSKVIKKFYTPFPTEEAAFNKAKGDPQLQQNLIEEWEAAGVYSTNIGSRVHFNLEKMIIERNGNYKSIRQPIFECDRLQILKSNFMIDAGEEYIKLMEERGAVLLDTETVLGHPNLGYTGQPDKLWLMMNKEKTNFGLVITDWKTNKPKNFKTDRFTKKMFKPFNDYPSTALGHYYIQLPLYGRLLLKMLENTKYSDLKLLGCVIVHLQENSKYTEYRVPTDVINKVMDLNIMDYFN